MVWDGLEKPRAIVVHPGKGIMFWTDWGSKPSIARADQDGTNRTILVSEGIAWPNGLVIEYASETLYWADAKHHVIESCHFDGSGRRKVVIFS